MTNDDVAFDGDDPELDEEINRQAAEAEAEMARQAQEAQDGGEAAAYILQRILEWDRA